MISYQIVLHPEAKKELEDSHQWYEDRSIGLGKRFIALVDKKINEIALNPLRFPKTKNGFRETMMSIFPFIIIYEVYEKDQLIFVSYIFHAKRNPRIKYKR